MGIVSIDDRGRIIIPKKIREKAGLRPDQALLIEIRGDEIVLKPATKSKEFINELKGCIHGSRVHPDELKEIWGVDHAHR